MAWIFCAGPLEKKNKRIRQEHDRTTETKKTPNQLHAPCDFGAKTSFSSNGLFSTPRYVHPSSSRFGGAPLPQTRTHTRTHTHAHHTRQYDQSFICPVQARSSASPPWDTYQVPYPSSTNAHSAVDRCMCVSVVSPSLLPCSPFVGVIRIPECMKKARPA